MSDPGRARRRMYRRAGMALGALLVVGVIGAMVFNMLAEPKSTKKQVTHQIALIRPLPPPPPPKPPEKPPEVKKEEVKIEEKVEQPKDAPQSSPESRPLGLDAEGGAGTDGFGLAANRGGADITVGGGTGGGNRQGYYSGIVQRHIQDALQRDKRLRGQEYRAVVHIWFREDGTVQRSQVVGSSGKPDTDASIIAALAESPPLRESFPSDLPQPVKLRVTSRL